MNIKKIKKLLKTVKVTSTYDGLEIKIPAFWSHIYIEFSDNSLDISTIDLLKVIIMNKDYQSAYIILTHKKSRYSLIRLFYNEYNIFLIKLLEETITINRDFLMSYIGFCQKMHFNFYSEKLKKLQLFL